MLKVHPVTPLIPGLLAEVLAELIYGFVLLKVFVDLSREILGSNSPLLVPDVPFLAIGSLE